MKVTKSENDGQHPASHYLIVEDPEKTTTWHLRVRDAAGKLDHTLMGAAKAALTSRDGYRGNKYDGPGREKAIEDLRKLYKQENLKWDASSAMSEARTPRFVLDLAPVRFGDGIPQVRLPIACIGTWVKGGQRFSITFDDFSEIYANWQKRNADIVVDYEHASEIPGISLGGPVPAAGWIKAIVPPQSVDRFLYADVEFTDLARSLIGTQQIRYVSPAINWGAKDKVTGKPQGTTLTSLALTNRPFLEDIPPLTLSDREYRLMDLDQVHVPAQVNSKEPARGGKEKPPMKKVKLSAIKAGDNKGHLRVQHADFSDDNGGYYADADETKQALDDADGDGASMSDTMLRTLSEAAGMKGRGFGEIVPAIRQRFGQKVLILSDVPVKTDGPDKGAPDFDKFLPADGTLVAADVFVAQEVEKLLNDAVQRKTILPKERVYLRKLSLNDLREYLSSRSGHVAVDTREIGHGDATVTDDQDALFNELHTDATKLLSEHNDWSYSKAFVEAGIRKPEVRRRYDELQKKKGRDKE